MAMIALAYSRVTNVVETTPADRSSMFST